MSEAGTWTWRDAGRVALISRWLLYAAAALYAGAVAVDLTVSPYEQQVNMAVAVFGLVQAFTFLAAAILFLRWIYLANANARALGATDLGGSPAWAVGWFFVPLANLAMPYVTVRDMWKASANPRDWQAEGSPGFVILWWTCWLVSSIAGAISFRLVLEGAIETLPAATMLSLVSDAVAISSSLLLATIVDRIQALQVRAWPASIY